MNKNYGIYEIRNKKNGRYNIGKHKNIIQRFQQHKKMLREGSHYNFNLQVDWWLYGEKNFEFNILETIPLKNQNLNNLAYLEAKHIYEINKEDYRNDVLYNFYSFRDEIIWSICNLLIREKYNFKFCRVRVQEQLFDFIIYDEHSNPILILDIHNPKDERGYDQLTIAKRKKFANQMGVEFQLLDMRGFYSSKTVDTGYRLPAEYNKFNIVI